ncbi:MAG: hypothetical protein JXB48_18485 [Candidatus Latescibacteria bacterium]|nr:hypothetical protein [Candidatus Latescibacterota bacterium]
MFRIINSKNETISFILSSEIFNFNRMIEECKSFLSQLGFFEISNIYIVLRELLFNTILFQTRAGKECNIDCRIAHKGNGIFVITLTGFDIETEDKLFDWVSQYSPESSADRSNTLIHGISDKIELSDDRNSVTVYVILEKIYDHIEAITSD